MAKLLGASTLSVYNWEGGKATQRRERLAAIVSLRRIGKREALARLDRRTTRQRSS